MEQKILYSFVVPIYNVEEYLQECINSLRTQSYKNIEIVLVDDGSSDGSGNICDRNAKQDGRIKVVHAQNGGVSRARQLGVKNANGEYILCVDADDWITTDCVEKVNDVVVNNGEPDVVTYGFYRLSPKASIKEIPNVPSGLYDDEKKRNVIFPKLIQDERNQYYPPGVCGQCFRRRLLLDNMISTGKAVIGEDMACTVSCIYHAQSVYVLHECMYYYRYNNSSVTKGKRVFPWSCAHVLAEHLNRKINLEESDLKLQLYRYVVHMLFVTAVSQFNNRDSYKNVRANIIENLNDEFYKTSIRECRFKCGSKGWLAHMALKYQLYLSLFFYHKVS